MVFFVKLQMPKVSVLLASHSGIDREPQPLQSLAGVIQELLEEAQQTTGMKLEPVCVVYSSTNKPFRGWDSPQRAVGVDDLAVMMQAVAEEDPVFKLTEVVRGLNNRLTKTTLLLAKPYISNTAAQVLNHAAGEPYRSSTCGKYAAMGTLHPGVVKLSKATRKKACKIVRNLDGVIDRRNNQYIHFPNTAALDKEVEECVKVIHQCRALADDCFWECWVLLNYTHFKAAFPSLTV
jgi:hypothetical protein